MLPVSLTAALCCAAGLGGGATAVTTHGDAVTPAGQVQIFAPDDGGGGVVSVGGGGDAVTPGASVQVLPPSGGATTPSQTDGQAGGGVVSVGGSLPETTVQINPLPGWTTAGPTSGDPGGVMPHSPVDDPDGWHPPTAWSPQDQ